MKTYSLPMGRRQDYNHPAPDRTAYRVSSSIGVDDYYQVWPNRASMARSIRMQESGATIPSRLWRPMIALGVSEGY